MQCELDHLVVAAAQLPEAVADLASRLGVPLRPGGRHELMGTHNALLGLGPGRYLEALAIEPGAAPPCRRRWFGLDDPAIREMLSVGPRLLHWVARCADLDSAMACCPWPTGRAVTMARGPYRWRIALPDDGGLPLDGIAPTLIEWRGTHPAGSLAESNCRLPGLHLQHPETALLSEGLERLGLRVEGLEISTGAAALRASISTPGGPVTLA